MLSRHELVSTEVDWNEGRQRAVVEKCQLNRKTCETAGTFAPRCICTSPQFEKKSNSMRTGWHIVAIVLVTWKRSPGGDHHKDRAGLGQRWVKQKLRRIAVWPTTKLSSTLLQFRIFLLTEQLELLSQLITVGHHGEYRHTLRDWLPNPY